ncbi:hypothetical protein [Gemmatimonas sp.]
MAYAMHPTERAAKEILASIEATFQPTHRFVRVEASRYRHLDLRFYDRTASDLKARGFTMLADVEDRTVTETPGTVLSAILVRTMASRDGTVMCALYHPHIRRFTLRALLWLLRKLPGKVTDMETECTDGSFVVTTNAVSAAAFDSPPLIATEYVPATTAPLDVYARHTQRVAEHLATRPGVQARTITSHDAMVASQNRMNALKAAFRGEVGGVTREELERLSVFGTRLAGDVHAAVVQERIQRAV